MGNINLIKGKTLCIRPTELRIKANQRIKSPTTSKRCKGFAGVANLLSLFCTELPKLLKPIYNLTYKERVFQWKKEKQKIFDEI